MVIRFKRLLACVSLLTSALSATAAGVSVEAFLITSSGVQETADSVLNGSACTPGSTPSTACVRIEQSVFPLMPNTGNVTIVRSVFDAGNVSQVPNFVMNGNARAFASLGQLHAATFVQIQGAGGNNVTVGGRATAQVTDRVVVRSAVLPLGTPVTIQVLMNVSGRGGARLDFGLNGSIRQVGGVSDFGNNAMQDYESSFSARVGDSIFLTYGLTAFTRMFSSGWSPSSVLNGRNNSSDYSNSVYMYAGGSNLAQGVTLQSDTGYTYALPSAVPEPGTWALWAAGLLGLGGLARSRRNAAATADVDSRHLGAVRAHLNPPESA